MQRLGVKLARELQIGARVVSCNFPLPGWHPKAILRPKPSRHGDPIFVYTLPEACRGMGMDGTSGAGPGKG
jgi:hypothetical protein